MIILERFITIHSPELLKINDEQGNIFFGGSQMWYQSYWQLESGCGPTACTNLLWYLSKTRPDCAMLSDGVRNRKKEFLTLMEKVWEYVTPGRMGINNTKLFVTGMQRYGKDCNVHLKCRILDIPMANFAVPKFGMTKSCRPSIEQVSLFLIEMFEKDLPVAFLNLSNGRLENLENWHWVTLVGFDADKKVALMYDQGKCRKINIELWLKTTVLGGGFVAADCNEP